MIHEILPTELAGKLNAGELVYLIDVRQEWEHALASLPNSVLIPLHQLPHRVQELQPPAGSLVVTYCHHGVRSLTAAEFLERQGLGDVYSLAGGIDAWSLGIDRQVPRY
ncbi:rhodanese-like domain-containing protein [soil metagenome]